MVFVSSDLHGCAIAEFQELLTKAGFTKNDFLFILGDVIDRGEHGAELLLWLTEQSNMQLLLGNHEALLLACDFLFEEVTDESLEKLSTEQLNLLESWIHNGGGPTLTGLKRIMRQDPELIYGILDYLRDAPLFEMLEVHGKSFVLVHAGLENFSSDRLLSDYEPDELLLMRPTLDTAYFNDALVVFGHTPTHYIDNRFEGKAIRTPSWICIDTGSSVGNTPMLLCLDNMEEFYLNT